MKRYNSMTGAYEDGGELVGGTCVVCGGTTIKMPISDREADAMFRHVS